MTIYKLIFDSQLLASNVDRGDAVIHQSPYHLPPTLQEVPRTCA